MGTTMEQIESYFISVEEFFSSSLTSVAPDLPHLREAAHRIWTDITRFGPPSLPNIPGLGSFKIPPPPPPPPLKPPPSTWDWLSDHRWIVVGTSAGIISTSILTAYGLMSFKRYCSRVNESANGKRHQIVGADHPIGLPLVLSLEAHGYLVYASVSSKEAGAILQAKSKGYVLPLLLDINEPDHVDSFLRSIASARLMRFPLTASGDPYTLTHSACYLQSIVSLAALFPSPSPCPFEVVSLRESYLPYLIRTHLTPFHIVQGLLPPLRRISRQFGDTGIRKSIIFCVPAIASRVGVPFISQESMSASATVRGAETLRRELQAAAQNGLDGPVSPKVVIIDVGTVGYARRTVVTPLSDMDPELITRSWSESELEAYSTSFKAYIEQARTTPRNPTHVNVFINAVVGVVSQGTKGRDYGFGYREGFNLATGKRAVLELWGRIHNCIRGDRFSIGAGVDKLLYIPHAMAAMRSGLQHMSQLPPTTPRAGPTPHAPIPLQAPLLVLLKILLNEMFHSRNLVIILRPMSYPKRTLKVFQNALELAETNVIYTFYWIAGLI
ncbi:hypothetical protein Clacol_006803 [Clathrus columnatus]|uniref:Uncharacterized protein n=1 Tax=Clathrus columnatus TaxID=1419009 RepID=A0AAV5AI65_9AGAM|nr:hypothetical protein Clacol_006803 [Clathrus columnatus]